MDIVEKIIEKPEEIKNVKKFAGGLLPERQSRRRRGGGGRDADDEWAQSVIDIARVTRVMAGGKRMRFRACMVVGDRNGRIGWAIAKGADVSAAMQKAVTKAKKNIISVSIVNGTIPHDVTVKFKAARILLKPAKKGKGLIAGGVVRTVLDLAGVQNIISKMLGSSNKINNVAASFKALSQLRRVDAQPQPAAGGEIARAAVVAEGSIVDGARKRPSESTKTSN